MLSNMFAEYQYIFLFSKRSGDLITFGLFIWREKQS